MLLGVSSILVPADSDRDVKNNVYLLARIADGEYRQWFLKFSTTHWIAARHALCRIGE
jgi:hypothetical protein